MTILVRATSRSECVALMHFVPLVSFYIQRERVALTYFMPLISFYKPWVFLCFQGAWKRASGMKWINVNLSNFDPFSTNVPLLYPLKTSENVQFFYVFRGYRAETMVETGLSITVNRTKHRIFINKPDVLTTRGNHLSHIRRPLERLCGFIV